MKLLLDTHIWLWLLREPERLGRRTLQELKSTDNEIWLSPMSTWEALTLHFKKRVDLGSDLAAWAAQATLGTREAPFTHEIALAARRLSLHQDPADRIIVATAQVLNATLVTADRRLLEIDTIRTLANR